MELIVLFVLGLAVVVFVVEWANKKFSETEEREAKEKAEKSDAKIETESVLGEKTETEKESTTPHHTGVVIKGRRKVEGKDTTVSAGRVYPIYTYEPDKKAAEWRCVICDAENGSDDECCCVCQHPRTGNEASVSYPCPGVSPPQGEVQKNQSGNAPEIDVQPSEKAEEKPTKKTKKNWPVLCAAAVLVLGAGWLYSMGETNEITPSNVVDMILQKEVEINGTVYDVQESRSLKAEVIRTQEDVDNIGKLTNLTELSFIWSGQSDVDLSVLSNLTQLAKLTVSCPNASVISFNFLQTLTNLKELTLISTGIGNMDDILAMTELTSLTLSKDGITDELYSGRLSALTKLEALNVSGNNITNIAFLRYLPSLKTLDVSDNNVTSVSPLIYCPKLETLKIDMISDIGVLQSLANLNYLRLGTGQAYFGKNEIDSYVTELQQSDEKMMAAVSVANELIELFENGQYDTVYSRQQDIYDTYGSFTCKGGTLTLYGKNNVTVAVEIPDGKTLIVKKDKSIYYGEYGDNQKSGQGTQVENGDYLRYYTGEWANNYPNGYGMACELSSNGTLFYVSGNFRNGLEDGVMTLTDYSFGYKTSGQYTATSGKLQSLGAISNGRYIYCYMDNGSYWYTDILSKSRICRDE